MAVPRFQFCTAASGNMHVLMPMKHPSGCGVLPTATARQAVMVFRQAYKRGCVLGQCPTCLRMTRGRWILCLVAARCTTPGRAFEEGQCSAESKCPCCTICVFADEQRRATRASSFDAAGCCLLEINIYRKETWHRERSSLCPLCSSEQTSVEHFEPATASYSRQC